MKHILAAVIAALLLFANGCEVPEDDGTAADRAKVNQKKDKGEAEKSKPEPKPEPKFSVTQENAIAKAEEYLDYSSFSRSGLIEQLEFDGFSNKDATFGVDQVNPDWNKQAAAKAEEYLDYSSFSRSGLIEQLEFDGFTTQQATYGVNKVGL